MIVWRMLGKWDGVLSACAMQPEFVNHPVSVLKPFPKFFGPNEQLSVTVQNVSGNLLMKSTIVA